MVVFLSLTQQIRFYAATCRCIEQISLSAVIAMGMTMVI
jgi:hypothetical protein